MQFAEQSVNIPRRYSLAALAIGTLALIVVSYLFTLAVAAGCLAFGLIPLRHLHSAPEGVLGCIAGIAIASVIVWSLVPRRDTFKPPGICVELATQPRLANLINDIAGKMGEKAPAEIHLFFDANAWVTQRGGFLGVGSRRYLGLGLPLLAVMNVSELRAILAHEFGHFYAGDTRLGPFVYSTRMAVIRMMTNLNFESGNLSFLRRFGAGALLHLIVSYTLAIYSGAFSRIIQRVSRAQEFRCDELASLVESPQAMIESLRKTQLAAAGMRVFWDRALLPFVSGGRRPPLAEGFHRFIQLPANAEAFAKTVENFRVNTFDSHPPLHLRAERAAKVPGSWCAHRNDAPAIQLLDDVDALEVRLLSSLLPDADILSLEPMQWGIGGVDACIPLWRKFVALYSDQLRGSTVAGVPELVRRLPEIGSRIRDPAGTLLTHERRTERAALLLCNAVSLQLAENGWTVHVQPGQLKLNKQESWFDPHQAIRELRSGAMTSSAWREWARQHQVASMPLVAE